MTPAPTVVTSARDRGEVDDRVPDRVTVSIEAPDPSAAAWIEPPVFRPAPPSRISRRWLLAVLVPLGALIWWFATGSGPARRGTLQVISVSVSIPTAERVAGCPGTTFVFTGRISTNGQHGRVQFRWTGPDAATRAPVIVEVRSGSRSVLARLNFSIEGMRTLHGTAALHVLAPSVASAVGPEVTYSCP